MTGLDWMYTPTPQRPSQTTTSSTNPLKTTTTTYQPPHLRPHPGHEQTSWDSPIEDETHPLQIHHHHSHHYSHHASGATSPISHPASPGFEDPWDSPISDVEPMTPLSETSEAEEAGEKNDYFSREVPAALFSPVAQKSAEEKNEKVEHPALGQTDGAFGRRGGNNCGVHDGMARQEFMMHMCGLCGCGRKEVMTPRRRE